MNSSLGVFIAFILHPFLGFYVALKSKRKKLINYGVYLLSFWIGLTFTLPKDGNSDVLRYQYVYENEFINKDRSLNEFVNYILHEGEGYDFFKPVVMNLLAAFNFPFEVFLGMMGWVFAFFFMRLFWLLYNKKYIGSKTYLVFLIFALSIIPIWYGINNIRFTLVSVVIALYILQPSKKLYLYMTLISPLIHYGAFLMIVLLLVYKLSQRLLTIPLLLIAFIVLSIMPKSQSLVDLNSYSVLPEYYEEGASKYTTLDRVEENRKIRSEKEASLSFHTYFMIYGYELIYILLPALLGVVFILDKNKFHDSQLVKQILFLGCIVSILLYFPSFGRYRYFVVVPAVFLLLKNFRLLLSYKLLKLPVMICTVAALLYSIVKLRTVLDSISIETITGSALYAWSTTLQSRTALIDLIK